MSRSNNRERRRKSVKLQLRDDHLIAIGQVAVRSAMFDLLVELTCDQISKAFPNVLQKRTRQFSTPQRMELIEQQLIKQLPRHKNAIEEYFCEARTAREIRSLIMHRVWRNTESDDEKELQEMRDWKPSPHVRVTAGSMMNLANQFIDLMFELADWKMFVNAIHIHESARSHGIRLPQGRPPTPPRTSSLDEEERLQLSRRVLYSPPHSGR